MHSVIKDLFRRLFARKSIIILKMKEEYKSITNRVIVANGQSRLLQVQSQRILASLNQLTVDINVVLTQNSKSEKDPST